MSEKPNSDMGTFEIAEEKPPGGGSKFKLIDYDQAANAGFDFRRCHD